MIGGLSMTEVIIILGLALLLLGPDQLPQMAKSIGKGLREIRKATDDLKGQFEEEIARIDVDAPPRRMIAPVPAPPDSQTANPAADPAAAAAAANDPAAARANARIAASAPPAPAVPPPPTAPPPPADPAEARAAARRAAADSAKLKLIPPAGTVPREGA